MTQLLHSAFSAHRRVRPVAQVEAAECGLACLAMVASYHGLDVDMPLLRRRFKMSIRGLTLRNLITIADQLGLISRAVRTDIDGLSSLPMPCILHWDMNHYVVLEKTAAGKAYIHDPGGRSSWLPLSIVSQHFTGVALELSSAVNFVAGDYRRKARFRDLWGGIVGLRRSVVQTVLLSVLLQIFAVLSPYYMQLAIDVALRSNDLHLLGSLALAFGLFAILSGCTLYLRSAVLLSIGSSFSFGLASNVARKLFRLPMSWFAQRHSGDVLARFQSVAPLRQMLAEDAPAVLVDGMLASIMLAAMFIYSSLLAWISIFGLIAIATVRMALFPSQRSAQRDSLVAAGREQSVMIESIRGMRSLRLANREDMRHSFWQSRMADTLNANIRYRRSLNLQLAIQSFAIASETIVSVAAAIYLVVEGEFTIGMVLAFVALKSQLLVASLSLMDKFAAFRLLSLHLERLTDITLADSEPGPSPAFRPDFAIQGGLALHKVSYAYGDTERNVIDDVSFEVMPGECVAIIGPSGGGKSTLLHILLGLFEPTSGEVRIDGVPLKILGAHNYHGQVAAVLQDDVLFAGSLTENISMFEDGPDMERVVQASKTAAIHDDITAMPMGFDTLVGDMGAALSGGQRQRVILARALYRGPQILVMDEATSSLDDAKEAEVSAAIARLGITRIFVAHRKETIATADRVLMLAGGKLVARDNGLDQPAVLELS